jgi:hypothetical protein
MQTLLTGWLVVLASFSAVGQVPAPAPRTPWGAPDLQGTWTTSTTTPMQRPAVFAGREFLTEQEAAEYAYAIVQQRDVDRVRQPGTEWDVTSAHNNYWFDRGTTYIATRRTSLIVDPKDGRIPARTPAGAAREARTIPYSGFQDPRLFDSWLDKGLWERCITRGLPGAMLPAVYNNYLRIFQTPDHVAIHHEIMDVRLIPLDNRPHVSDGLRQWMGHSVGHWEGDTLIVDTRNFTSKTNFMGAEEGLHLIERFRRDGTDSLVYQATLDDPDTFTRPWTFELPIRRVVGPVYEYACHEGNKAMAHMLSGARARERDAASKPAPR